jgi:hypothetical protein
MFDTDLIPQRRTISLDRKTPLILPVTARGVGLCYRVPVAG